MEPNVINDWAQLLSNQRAAGANLSKANEPVVKAFFGLNESLHEANALDLKTRELIALAVAVTTRCGGCIAAHAATAQKAGASRQEVAEALGTAIALNAGAAFVYSARALEAFDQFGNK